VSDSADSSGPLKPVTKRPWSGCGIARVGTHHQTIVAYLAMSGSYIDRMYVDPTEWRKGWGARLVAFAMKRPLAAAECRTFGRPVTE
jgi:hypothetical protein